MADINKRGANRTSEQGMVLISWLLVLVVAGIFILAVVRLVPAYIEYGEIGSVLHAVRDTAMTKPLPEVRSALADQLSVDDLTDVQLQEFKFTTNGNRLTISINHAIPTPFIGNLGFVVHCRRSMTVTRAEQ